MSVSTELLDEIRELVAEVLCVEIDEVRPHSGWLGDFDGESLELLELSFRIERKFGVRVRFQDLDLSAIELDAERRLTPASLKVLTERYPFLHLERVASNPVRNAMDLLTVEGIAGLVQDALDKRP